ncbi:MAG: ATP phosphoribosyltransferase regulatory subunit [Candidatus Cloacimonas sp.]
MVQEPQSFHEFMPNKVWKWKILEEKIDNVLSLHDFQEIRLSVLQSTQVLQDGITALIQGEEAHSAMKGVLSLSLPEDKLSLLSLRPEGTISVLHHTAQITNPGDIHRFYYSGPMFRKINNQHQMEFYQLGVELLGSESILSENEVIALGMKLCQTLGLNEVRLDLNSYGCANCRPPFFADLHKYLEEHKSEYCQSCYYELSASPFSEVHCNDPNCKKTLVDGPQIHNYLCKSCKADFNKVKNIQANLGNHYKVNPHLNKNFAYYNKTVFDFIAHHKGKEVIIGGGGRYDYLSSLITGKNIPAVGFYLNLDVIFDIMDSRGLFEVKDPEFTVYICAQNPNLEMMTLQIAQELHSQQIKTIISPECKPMETEIENAKNMDSPIMLILRDDNIREGKILLRNLMKEEQNYIPLKDTLPSILLARKSLQS